MRLDEETEGCQQLGKTVAYLESAVLLQLLGELSNPCVQHRSGAVSVSAVAFLSVSMG